MFGLAQPKADEGFSRRQLLANLQIMRALKEVLTDDAVAADPAGCSGRDLHKTHYFTFA